MNIKKRLLLPVNFSGTLRNHDNDKFGAYRTSPKGKPKKHSGVDLFDNKGNPVKAVLDGKIIRASWNHIYGNLIIIDHTPTQISCQAPQYTYTLYAHLDSTTVKYDQQVKRGKKIGTVGKTGNADRPKTNPHLHFEVIRSKGPLEWNKTANTGIEAGLHRVDPLPYLNGRSIDLGEEEENPYAELLRMNPLATRYDFMKFASDNNIPRR